MPCPTCHRSLLLVARTVEGENGLHYCTMECASDGMDAGHEQRTTEEET